MKDSPIWPDAAPAVHAAVLLFTSALALAGCGGQPEAATDRRGASLGGLGPAVTTPIAEVTASVFVLELWVPEGVSRADAEAADTRALQREAAELALKVTETKVDMGLVEETRWVRKTVTLSDEAFQGLARRGSRVVAGTEIRRSTSVGTSAEGERVETHSYTVTVESPAGRYEAMGRPRKVAERYWAPMLEEQRAALAALPRAESRPPGRLELRERWRYVTVFPPVPELEEGQFHTKTRDGQDCRACSEAAQRRNAVYLSSFGAPGVDPAMLDTPALEAGMELAAREVVFGGADHREPTRVERTSVGRLTLQRVATCPGRIVRVEDTLTIHRGSDVIAVPYREDQMWHELRDAACVGTTGPAHEVFGPSGPLPPGTAKDPVRFWIEQHRAELARLERRELKQALP